MKKGNKEKSNRAQADYFELLVCQHICCLYNVTFSYSKNIAKLISDLLKKKDGNFRLETQTRNFHKICPEIKKILDNEIKIKGRIVRVKWIGRHFVIEQTTSDVDAEHQNNKKTRFSIKSIEKSGTGTLKNLGLKKLEDFFGFNFQSSQKEMWNALEKFLSKRTRRENLNRSQMKKLARSRRDLLRWATDNGKKFQKKLNSRCLESFNKLSIKKKRDFLNFILSCSDPDLYVIIVNDSGVTIYKPTEKMLYSKDKIVAKEINGSEVGYAIFINNVPSYRVQTNNTNGIGVSAFCQRIFLI